MAGSKPLVRQGGRTQQGNISIESVTGLRSELDALGPAGGGITWPVPATIAPAGIVEVVTEPNNLAAGYGLPNLFQVPGPAKITGVDIPVGVREVGFYELLAGGKIGSLLGSASKANHTSAGVASCSIEVPNSAVVVALAKGAGTSVLACPNTFGSSIWGLGGVPIYSGLPAAGSGFPASLLAAIPAQYFASYSIKGLQLIAEPL